MNNRKEREPNGLSSASDAKNKYLASNIIQNHHKYTNQQFHNISIPEPCIHSQVNDRRFHSSGKQAAADKLTEFRDHRIQRPVITPKYEGFIGQIGKQNGKNPCNHITKGSRKSQNIIAGQIHNIIDRCGQNTKNQINHNISVILYPEEQFIHQVSSCIDLGRLYHVSIDPARLHFPFCQILLTLKNAVYIIIAN